MMGCRATNDPGVGVVPHWTSGPTASDTSTAGVASRDVFTSLRGSTTVGTPAVPRDDEVWVADQVLVKPIPEVLAEDLALDLGVTFRPGGGSGYASFAVPRGLSAAAFVLQLKDHPWVASVSRMAYIHGANSQSTPGPAHPSQWHLAAARAPWTGTYDVSELVVAVLDTGVAYEDHQDEHHAYVGAASLRNVRIVAPYDFVHDDAHPNDDHQHGTHIASLIASEGGVEGVASGVGLMPIKVLDEHNRGTEQALVDGITHAVAHGAHVINMSLSFPVGYVPSPALEQALLAAHDAGVVMVAAAGNAGLGVVTWPAASRLVIGVGASRPVSDTSDGQNGDSQAMGPTNGKPVDLREASYSNLSNALDLLAPGGSLDDDLTGDGHVDGMLAETILPGDPSRTAYWLYAGTSQAAAVVSGAAVHLLAGGADPEQVPSLLQIAARSEGLGHAVFEGIGAGNLDIEGALTHLMDDGGSWAPREISVGLLPFLQLKANGVVPKARVWPMDADGSRLEDGTVLGTLVDQEGGHPVSCRVRRGEDGCDLVGEARAERGAGPMVFSVDGVVLDDVAYRPTAAIFATDAAEVLLAALGHADLQGTVLGFHFPYGDDPVLGAVADAYVVHNGGTGLISSPMSVLLPGASLASTVLSTVDLDLDGTGLLSSPLGLLTATSMDLAGGRLVSLDGTGLLSSPLGLHPAGFYGPDSTAGTGLLSSPLGLQGELVDLGRQTASADLAGSMLGSALSGEGFRMPSGEEAANALVGSGAVDLAAGGSVAGSGAGQQSMDDNR